MPNNLSITDVENTVNRKTYLNWTHNIVDWTTRPANTNLQLAAVSSLTPYLSSAPQVFRCPSDDYLSSIQRQAGWVARVRTYSMNSCMGAFTPAPLSQYNASGGKPKTWDGFRLPSSARKKDVADPDEYSEEDDA